MRRRHLSLLCAGGLILGAASPANDRFERAAALETLEGTGNLRDAFNADKDRARLMVALSPT